PPRAGGPPLHPSPHGAPEHGPAVGPPAHGAHLFRRIARARRRRAPRDVGFPHSGRRETTDAPDRKREGGRTLTMLALLLSGALKGAVILALALLLTRF